MLHSWSVWCVLILFKVACSQQPRPGKVGLGLYNTCLFSYKVKEEYRFSILRMSFTDAIVSLLLSATCSEISNHGLQSHCSDAVRNFNLWWICVKVTERRLKGCCRCQQGWRLLGAHFKLAWQRKLLAASTWMWQHSLGHWSSQPKILETRTIFIDDPVGNWSYFDIWDPGKL